MARDLLSSKIKLSDGSWEKAITTKESGVDGESGADYYECRLCRVVIHAKYNANIHVKGKKHMKKMKEIPDAVLFRSKLGPLNKKNNFGQDVGEKIASDEKKFAPLFGHNLIAAQKSSDTDLQGNAIDDLAYRMEQYKISVELATAALLKEYKKYRQTPENHPKYGEEWKEFWEIRYGQLKKGGKVNPNEYDYKPEWRTFWMKRMDDILEEQLKTLKKEIRSKLDLSDDYKELRKTERKRSQSYESISSDESLPPVRPRPAKKSRVVRSSSSSSYSYERSRSYRRYYSPERSPEYDGPVTFISVCRLLSALETDLGSMSSKVIDLLTKAIECEKLEPNSSDELLMTKENSIFLETVKEKMKGLLMVKDMLPDYKCGVVKKCVQNIAILIHQTPVREEKLKERLPVETTTMLEEKKILIAKEIAESLKAHGKEDCTMEELEVLVEMILDEKASDEGKVQEETKAPQNLYEDITDDDLKVLLGSFSELCEEEQNNVIKFMGHIEKTEPKRVETLRQFVEINNKESKTEDPIDIDDDDEDDYNFSEVISKVVENLPPPEPQTIEVKIGVVKDSEGSLTDNLLKLDKSLPWNSQWN